MKAMILAAGKGERMRPLTLTCPKPLLCAGGKTLIDYHIDRLRAAGLTDLVINRAWLGEKLAAHLGGGADRGVSITWSVEGQPLETAGGIRYALDRLAGQGDWFAVVNGDVWCDFDFTVLRPPAAGVAQLVLTDNPIHNPGGDFQLQEDGTIRAEGPNPLTFTGISLLHRDLFSGAYGDDAKLAPLLRRAAEAGQVHGLHYRGHWFDIGTPERLEQLDRWLRTKHE
jgi:MurNAc alpha-1-phosphate uridylyltransferase